MIQAEAIAAIAAFGCFASTAIAQELDPTPTITVSAADSTILSWAAFVEFCGIMSPFGSVLLSLAPLPTMRQIARDKTVGKLPLLPYSTMITNSSLWLMYGLLENLMGVARCSVVGVTMGAYYIFVFVQHCSADASNLPGTVLQHVQGAGAIILINLCLAVSGVRHASEIIGKEGVIICIILFASPLSTMRNVIATKSADSIPLPFTLACLVNCTAWFVAGYWNMKDFNIYFPNMLGIVSAAAQVVLKCMFRKQARDAKVETRPKIELPTLT
ncbi:hypothetical protein ACHAXH_009203 [Discostella pseudostelligera]